MGKVPDSTGDLPVDRRGSRLIRALLLVAWLIGLGLLVAGWFLGWALFAVWLGDELESVTGIGGLASIVVEPALLVIAAMLGYLVLARTRQ